MESANDPINDQIIQTLIPWLPESQGRSNFQEVGLAGNKIKVGSLDYYSKCKQPAVHFVGIVLLS